MWVRRWILYIKPGRMAEAVAHLKTAPPEEGVTVRLLRPICGAQAGETLIAEASFDDPDAQYAPLSDPQPPNEWMQRWIEISQSRGTHELYQVEFTVETEGTPGLWIDRRVRWVKDGWRGEALKRWQQAPLKLPPGTALRILTPCTGELIGNVLVVETTFESLTESETTEMLSQPEGRIWATSVKALEMHEPTLELLRVVP